MNNRIVQLSGLFNSTSLRHFEYYGTEKRLFITFQTGSTYMYSNVPHSRVTALLRATSAGKYFNQHIRNNYLATKQPN